MGKKKRKGKPGLGLRHAKLTTPSNAVCRDCGKKSRIPRADFYRAAAPRCPACGGGLDLVNQATAPTRGGHFVRPRAKK